MWSRISIRLSSLRHAELYPAFLVPSVVLYAESMNRFPFLVLLTVCLAFFVPASANAGDEHPQRETQETYTYVFTPSKHVSKGSSCPNHLVRTLHKAGFTGKNLREAWAIAMRESHGKPHAVSATNDIGLFQLNTTTWHGKNWWDRSRLLHAKYSARMAYKISDGGDTWYPWGLTGEGQLSPRAYRAAGWSETQIQSSIVKPYEKYYHMFTDLPRSCRILAR